MSLTKVSEAGIQKIKEDIARLKIEIREHEAIAAQKDSELWKRIGPSIKKAIEANREKVDVMLASGPYRLDMEGREVAVDPMSDYASLKALGGAIAFGKKILAEVEVDATIEAKRARVQKLTDDLKRIADEQGL